MLPIEHTKYRNTVKFNVRAPGLYNFIKGFLWAYKRGGGVCGGGEGAEGNQKNNSSGYCFTKRAYIRLISRIISSLANGWV